MLLSAEIIETIAETLNEKRFRSIPLIIDPVFAATSGTQLIRDNAIASLTGKLFPLASLITPNMPEAERLTGLPVKSVVDIEHTAARLFETFGIPILLKGGHLEDKALDILVDQDGSERYESRIITGVNNHGSGCTLASAIAAATAIGQPLRQAVQTAKSYIGAALEQNLPLGPNLSVINHFPG
jgi:hydroxymethylpyrimidine/phosphomethylpyrimidine kinase